MRSDTLMGVGTSPLERQVWQDRRSVSVLGMGIALPGAPITTEALLERLRSRFAIDVRRQGAALAARLNIRRRHLSRDLLSPVESPRAGDTNAELAARALMSALDQAQLSPNDLHYLIGHTATPGRLLPPNIAQVAERIGFRGPFVELRQACTGFANALTLAMGLLHTASSGPIAIVGSETGSVFFDPRRMSEDAGQLVNLVQMGDAAAACVLAPVCSVSAAPQISHLYYGQLAAGHAAGFSLEAGGSDRICASDSVPEFQHDYRSVCEQGPELFGAAIQAARDCGIDLRTTDVFIPHQVNGRMAHHLAERLEVLERQIFVNADRVGNTGSAAIWLALADLRTRLRPGESVCVLGAEATHYMYGGFGYVHA